MSDAEARMELEDKLATDLQDPKMARKYLANQLNAEQEETFELWLAEHPEYLDQMNGELALSVGLSDSKTAAIAGVAKLSQSTSPEAANSPWPLAAAAAMVACVVPVAMWMGAQRENAELREQLASINAVSGNGELVFLAHTRSNAAAPTIFSAGTPTFIQAIVDFDDDVNYLAKITKESGEVLSQLTGLKAVNGEVGMLIPAGALGPGEYVVELTADNDDANKYTYSVVVE